MLPQTEGGIKCFLSVYQILGHRFLSYRNKLTSYWQNVLTVMATILINKDVFEPSYNDLKFMFKKNKSK